MKGWNAVITVREGGYSQACRLLERFGEVSKTGFFNTLVMRAADPHKLLDSVEQLTPETMQPLARVMPVMETFIFNSPQEFETNASQTVSKWLPSLAHKGFHVRMHRRGFKGKLSSMDEERFLDHYLLEALEERGTPARITFDNPDAIIALETIGPQAGVSFWTSEDLRRHPLLHLD